MQWSGDGYQIVRKLGEGGMAEILLAESANGPPVAIKRVKETCTDEQYLKLFNEEARVMAALSHRNIVSFIGRTMVDGSPAMVLEYLEGYDIRGLGNQLARRKKRFTAEAIYSIAYQISSALAYAHMAWDPNGSELKIVHRDISPGNIFINKQGIAKLLDFGVVKAEQRHDTGITVGSQIKGSLRYMSPEQGRGEDVDGRSDQFSLAIVLYEISAMRRYYHGSDSDLAVLRELTMPNARAEQALKLQYDSFAQTLHKALSYSKEDRFPEIRDICRQAQLELQRAGISNPSRPLSDLLKEIESSPIPPPPPR